MEFADSVNIKSIPRTEAVDLYNNHHSYMSGDDLHNACMDHHGIYFQGNLMGAITYRYPLMRHKRLYFDAEGHPLPEPLSDADYEKLPDDIRPTARELIPQISEAEVAQTKVVDGDAVAEAARICLGERMPNLASCGLAHSQEQFFRSAACPDEVSYLVTFVRSDFKGSMVRALRDKGWRCVGWTRPSQASNRPEKEIRNRYKWCFLCPIETIVEQCSIMDWVN